MGETKEEALIRECKEELNILLFVGDVFIDAVYEYSDLTVHLTLFNAIAQMILKSSGVTISSGLHKRNMVYAIKMNKHEVV